MRRVLRLVALAAIGLPQAALAGQCNFGVGGSFDDFARACSNPPPRAAPQGFITDGFSGPVVLNPNQVIVIERGVPVIVERPRRYYRPPVQTGVQQPGFTTGNIGPFTTFSNSPPARSYGR